MSELENLNKELFDLNILHSLRSKSFSGLLSWNHYRILLHVQKTDEENLQKIYTLCKIKKNK